MSTNGKVVSSIARKQAAQVVAMKVANNRTRTKKKAVTDKSPTEGMVLISKSRSLHTVKAASASVQKAEEVVSNYREHTRSKLAKEFPKIVDTMLRAAKAGRLTDTKMRLLLDLAGVKDHPEGRSIEKTAPGLGELLLNEIKRRNVVQASLSKFSEGAIGVGILSGRSVVERAVL